MPLDIWGKTGESLPLFGRYRREIRTIPIYFARVLVLFFRSLYVSGRSTARRAPEPVPTFGAKRLRCLLMPAHSPALPFREAVQKSILVFDGAMGSLLYERGVLHTRTNFPFRTSTVPSTRQ